MKELIFATFLKRDVSESVIYTLKTLVGQAEKREDFPEDFPEWAFRHSAFSKCWETNTNNTLSFDTSLFLWKINVRCEIENHQDFFGKFLAWIKPHLEPSDKKVFAIILEEGEEPKFFKE